MGKQATAPSAAAAELARQQDELTAIIERYSGSDGLHPTPIPGLMLFRESHVGAPNCGVYRPVLALLGQGAKRVTLGDESYDYDRNHYLVAAVDLPIVAQIVDASPQRPMLGFAYDLDAHKIAQLMGELALPPATPAATARGLAVSPLTTSLLDPALRLARLLATPDDILALAPAIERELLYRLLTGEQGARLRNFAASGSHGHRIGRAIDWLKRNFHQPLSIEFLADTANMSKSSLHQHFKALTAMSPLQYQKQLRLQEARRLMLVERHDAAAAGHRVGYESPSQFSREYRRLFGAPPLQDIARLRQQA